jgi:P pilus assembly chaperone PapD
VRKQNNAQNRLFFVAVIALSVLVSWGGSAFGQFVVQPMRMDLPLMPKQRFQTALSLQSLDPNEVHSVDIDVVDLGQYEDGQWRIIEPNEQFDRSKLKSCRDWISVASNFVEIQPMKSARVRVNIQVPMRTRGFYAAAIITTVRPRPEIITEFNVRVRFLTPVFIEVQGRPLRHSVKLKDMGLDFVGAFKDTPATTHVLMSIDNDGQTRSHLKGFAQIKGFLQGHWREITTAEFLPASIIPGAKLKLRANIGRSLPPGQYKVGGWLYVDGRRDQRVTRDIDFAGDPSVKAVASDAPIDLIPTSLSIRSVPGATRVEGIKVYNASDENVNVQAAVRLPQSLLGVAFGDIKGDDLDCTDWLQIQPKQFTLRSHSQQAIRIISKMPNNVSDLYPCYYAVLGLVSTYADGQTGGVTTAPICVTNQNISIEPYVRGMDLRAPLKGGTEYYVVARYGNFGRVHFTPIRCRAAIVDGTGSPLAMASLVSRKTDMVLPLEARDYSGIIDISRVPEGNYRLATELRYGSSPAERADNQIGIRVMAQGGQKVIEVLQLQEELGGKIEVQW